MPGRSGDRLRERCRVEAGFYDHAARENETLETALVQLLDGPADELIDVAMIVCEQDPGLDHAPVGAGIVHEPPQGVVHPDGIEQRQGARLIIGGDPGSVGHLVAHG